MFIAALIVFCLSHVKALTRLHLYVGSLGSWSTT
jgi:hypothetical protein